MLHRDEHSLETASWSDYRASLVKSADVGHAHASHCKVSIDFFWHHHLSAWLLLHACTFVIDTMLITLGQRQLLTFTMNGVTFAVLLSCGDSCTST